MTARRGLAWLLPLAVAVVALALLLPRRSPSPHPAPGRPSPPGYVGAVSCERCHAVETARWRGSHHDLAMQRPDERTVLGDFHDAEFSDGTTTTRFRRRGREFIVRTEGPDGRAADFPVRSVFGVTPLQQLLLELPGGRLQAFGVAWDSRPKKDGGQRWFHLYPGQRVDHNDVLHWTKLSQSWNSQCAECHSTNLRKGYVPAEDRYETTFSEIDVACEACHGPGSRHVAWAEAARAHGGEPSGDPGLIVRFSERRSRSWEMDLARGIARPTRFLETRFEVETCARCHARRGVLSEDYVPGRLLGQTHRPALLDEGLYYDDGQMKDEVYNWGSFLQSRMYAVGVTCSDCHDPHGLKVKVGRDQVCSSCHQPERFATRKHHFHKESGTGASCVACHMRTETYMGVDARHDHSFRVPRPDLSVELGLTNAPNSCSDCHRDRSPAWAAAAVRRFYPNGRSGTAHWAQAIHAGRSLAPGAEQALLGLLRDPKTPGIVRGTALTLLPSQMTASSLPALAQAVRDADPLVRLGAAVALEALPSAERVSIGASLLQDPVLAVRVEAVSTLAEVADAELTPEQRSALRRAIDEYEQAQRTNAERPESHVNLGILQTKRGRPAEARASYEAALKIAPWFVPAYVNLADLFRAQGRDEEAEPLLRRALQVDPASAAVHHALGLLLVRRHRLPDALPELARAAELAPQDARFRYAYAIALRASGRTEEALRIEATGAERPAARAADQTRPPRR